MDDMHWYELTLVPTLAQEAELRALLTAAGGALLAERGLVEPLAPGWVAVRGVSGTVCAGTHWDRQLPPWAQAVLGREYATVGRGLPVPALRSACRVDWAEIRREAHGWTLDLVFCWEAYSAWQLTCGVDTGGEENAELRVLMGNGSPERWPQPTPIPRS